RMHRGRDISQSDCGACHDPHASPVDGLLRRNQHAPFAGGNCATCHTEGGAAAEAFAIQGDIRPLCIKCHRGAQEYDELAYNHNLDQEGSCVQCHNPHAGETPALLLAEETVLCMRCHFNAAEFEKPKEAYLTHDGMDCGQCHLPHGAENPGYFVAGETEMCAGCHENAHRSSHPVGPEVIDRRTGEPVTCLSCHQLHGPDFEDYLPLDPAMDLCIQCHRR
ncbi:MAG: hypothetical protein GF355_09945, partial [Candidatus Eisenbacteria bacterium]|nr:hypothetical protein [Candidatus Eisenbacteria bacterium]